MKSIKTVAIIPAAGFGLRMRTDGPKQYLELDGSPVLALTLDKFNSCPLIDCIILVVPSEDIEFCQKDVVEKYNFNKVYKVIAGGERRQDSVRLGVEASNGEFEIVVIHDGVRPFVQTDLIEKSVKAMENNRAVITAMPAKDTAKKVGEGGLVLKTYERKLLWLVQTPQVFRYKDIWKAHQKAVMEGWDEVTDDALLLEKMGIPVKVIMGSEMNIKITTPYDMELARFLISREA